MEKKKESKKPTVKSVVFTSIASIKEIEELTKVKGSYTSNPLEYRFDDKTVSVGDEVVSTDGVITIVKFRIEKNKLNKK